MQLLAQLLNAAKKHPQVLFESNNTARRPRWTLDDGHWRYIGNGSPHKPQAAAPDAGHLTLHRERQPPQPQGPSHTAPSKARRCGTNA